MTRDEAVDVLWAAMIVTIPLGSDLPNTAKDRETADRIIAGFCEALSALGVTFEEMTAAQQRWEARAAA